MSREDWQPPEWWPVAFAALREGATYREAGVLVQRSRAMVQKIDARLGFPGRIKDEGEIERDIACVCCGNAARPPRLATGIRATRQAVKEWHNRPLCPECRPLGKAAWLLRGQGLAWHEVAVRLHAYPNDFNDIKAAKVNYKARMWAKRYGYTPKPVAKRDAL